MHITSEFLFPDTSQQDMDLIEILWKQDIDLGVSREAYDSRPCVEVEKVKDAKENLQEFYLPGEEKGCEESKTTSNPFAGLNYTVDSETGEFVLDEFSGLSVEDISSGQLLDNVSHPTLNSDSYLPLGEEDDIEISDLFPLAQFPDLSSENYSDSEYLLSQIHDLESFIEKDQDEATPEDVFPNIDDCWPDSPSMLPLLALGNSHQNSFVPLPSMAEATYAEPTYRNSLSSNMPSQSNQDFANTSALEASTLDESFHPIPPSLGPSSVGCALAESIATLHNDSDPIPTSSLLNTAYNPDLPEMLYPNQSLTAPHNELLINHLFTDEDFQLAAVPSEGNQQNLTEDRIDSSSDTTSLASGVPSISDCDVVNPDLNGASFEHSNGNDPQYFSIKCEYDNYENAAVISGNELSTYRKFDYASNRPLGAVSNNILQHNHSYHLPFSSNDSRYKPILRDKLEEEDSCNKDEKKAKQLKLPISIDDIINLAIEEYNERLSKYELTDQQLNLIRDIRRRGKNKVAAQNCRKRKMDQISSLQQDLDALHSEKLKLKSKQDHLLEEKHCIEDKYAQLYHIVSEYSNCKPPDPPSSHTIYNNQVTLPTQPDSDDSDLSRGARTKRKFKK